MNEYSKKDKEEQVQYRLPFGGGSGAGVNINPIAFLVVQADNVKLLPVNHSSPIDKLLDYMPDAIDKVNSLINKQMQIKNDEKAKAEDTIESEKDIPKEKESKHAKKEKTITRTKPKKGRTKDNETLEFEYNEVPPAEDILIDIEEQGDFDD